MTRIKIGGVGDFEGEAPIVIVGANGAGKTQLAQTIATENQVSAIGAQRRIWIDDNLPVQEEELLRTGTRQQQHRWQSQSWHPTEEINFILSQLIQDHTNVLTSRNADAIRLGKPLEPVSETKLILLQGLFSAKPGQ